jgi:hypothetical protein
MPVFSGLSPDMGLAYYYHYLLKFKEETVSGKVQLALHQAK